MAKQIKSFFGFIYRLSLKYRKVTILLMIVIPLLICCALILPFFLNSKYKAVKVIDDNTIDYNGYRYKRITDFLGAGEPNLSVDYEIYPSPSNDIVKNKNRLIGYAIRSWENNKYYIDDYTIFVYHKRLYIEFMPRCTEVFMREDFNWSNIDIKLYGASINGERVSIDYSMKGNELINDMKSSNIPNKCLCQIYGKISDYQEIWFELYCDSNPNYYVVIYAYDAFENDGRTFIYSASQDMVNYLKEATYNFSFKHN